MVTKRRSGVSWSLAVVSAVVLGCASAGPAQADIPKETFEALKLDPSAGPKELHEALTKRYRDPEQGAGKGKYSELWEPIPMSKYTDPLTFYEPPATVKEVAGRKDCVECHADETPGWVDAWKKSVHSKLDDVRALKPDDPTYYRKQKLEEVEKNLRAMGKLAADAPLKEVGCIDCHVDIGTDKKADHRTDLRLPTADICGTCHLQEFAERESERDTQIWPKDQWPKGRPSHALDYRANVETGIWAGMPQREVAEGCTLCHYNQNKCDGCHTRHEFSTVEARKPEACATCHSGIDHNNYENYSYSKHGIVYKTLGHEWNWNVPLKDAFAKGGQTAPTCATCHMEYNGKFSHNVVRKVRWANYPAVPGIAENIKDKWSEERKEAWVVTCTNCHGERLARSYLELMDEGTLAGVEKYKETHAVVDKLYQEGLLPGQKTNRPPPPAPEKEGMAQFYQYFWTKGNNTTAVEFEVGSMGENQLAKMHVSLAHVNPGNWSYSDGWEQLNASYAKVMQYDTEIRERVALQERVAKLEGGSPTAMLKLDSAGKMVSLGSLGGGMLLAGSVMFWRGRRRDGEE
ncbi:MAG: Hydroxylamine oxidoreductase [Gammaproteobacteria bacterium]|nr:Hydroxylamine oxidoreductase [Gammaproteobacteria bacterium]